MSKELSTKEIIINFAKKLNSKVDGELKKQFQFLGIGSEELNTEKYSLIRELRIVNGNHKEFYFLHIHDGDDYKKIFLASVGWMENGYVIDVNENNYPLKDSKIIDKATKRDVEIEILANKYEQSRVKP